MNEVRGDLEQNPPLVARLPDAKEVAVLYVANATVHDLVGVGAGRRAEVRPIDNGDREATLRGIPSRTDPEDAGADDNQVELARAQLAEISIHRSTMNFVID